MYPRENLKRRFLDFFKIETKKGETEYKEKIKAGEGNKDFFFLIHVGHVTI